MLWMKPKLPLEPALREWVDHGFERFVDIFGSEFATMASAVTPTLEFFPDDYDATEESVRNLFSRVCGYMGVNTNSVILQVYIDEDRERIEQLRKALVTAVLDNPGAAGLYRGGETGAKPVVAIDQRTLRNLDRTIATMAHELAHVLLLGGKHIDRDAPDMEPLTDLMTVFRGMGVLTANSAMNFEQHGDGQSFGWSVRKLGYLAEPTYGYSLAKFASIRGERRPRWTTYLNLNVRTYFNQSCAVLDYEARRK